jgi:hypothetical protein
VPSCIELTHLWQVFPFTDIQRPLTCNWGHVRIYMLQTTCSKYVRGFLVLSKWNNKVNAHKISVYSFETLTQMKHTAVYHYRLQNPAIYLCPEPDKSYPLPISSGVTATSACHIILCTVSGIFFLHFSTKPSMNFLSPPSVPHNLSCSPRSPRPPRSPQTHWFEHPNNIW